MIIDYINRRISELEEIKKEKDKAVEEKQEKLDKLEKEISKIQDEEIVESFDNSVEAQELAELENVKAWLEENAREIHEEGVDPGFGVDHPLPEEEEVTDSIPATEIEDTATDISTEEPV